MPETVVLNESRESEPPRPARGPGGWQAPAVIALFLVIAVARPHLLAPLNRLWFKVGVVLHHVVTPIVMGVIFVLGVLPTALIRRARRGDPLRLDPRRRGESNWVVRAPPGPSPDTMRHLF